MLGFLENGIEYLARYYLLLSHQEASLEVIEGTQQDSNGTVNLVCVLRATRDCILEVPVVRT